MMTPFLLAVEDKLGSIDLNVGTSSESSGVDEEGWLFKEAKNQPLRSPGRDGNLDFPQQRANNKTLLEEKDKYYTSSESRVEWPDLNKRVYHGTDGRTIGKLLVLRTEIAKGSNETSVVEGFYEGRAVAVKSLRLTHHDIALKEIELLRASDWHQNIVRWYGWEYDEHFVYLALERCNCSVGDLIQILSPPSQSDTSQMSTPDVIKHKNRLDAVKAKLPNLQDLSLWIEKESKYHPSPLLLKLMKDIVKGLAHLHHLKPDPIIHRDLKPQNVLVMIKEGTVCAKVADMGISKRLRSGTAGWKAPEQLDRELGSQKRAVDLFSFGCVLFYCITRGMHPFGNNHHRRDVNVLDNNIVNLSQVDHIPEASDLISRLLEPKPDSRPKALEVLNHPLFWDSETRLSFYKTASDRVQPDIKSGSVLLTALEATATVVECENWDQKLNSDNFVDNIKSRRLRDPINFNSVRELVRVIRSKSDHYDEQTPDIKNLLGSYPEGYYDYFASKFPKLFIEVYKVFYTHCRGEDRFKKYFEKEVA
ncbi:hypothetical protein COLO4_27942 [Corchorus olitorius]|uniref:non-specific serine/threonine protein kinase n=1 Tax=Corchorus olitorius TaxID=93759 RepID=A0A1R3HNP6_9ROSI|nr:hypothetical protein COLO4_27942 [Corchorus olitorius]